MNGLLKYSSASKLVVPILLIVPNILLWAGILAVDGIIIQRDFNFPIFNENFEESYFPLWNDVTSQTNIERFPRLVMMSPFIALSMLGVEMSLILKTMIISAFALVTTTTYLFATSLLRRFNIRKDRTIWIKSISLLGAYIFAYSPTTMQFAWEISFVASIGVLPLMLYFILAKPTSRYLPLLLAICLLFSLAHPFFFIMNIIISVVFMLVVNHRTFPLRFTLSKIVLCGILAVPLLAWLWMPYMAAPVSSIELGRDEHLERNIFDAVSANNLYRIIFLERERFAYVDTAPDDLFTGTFHYTSLALLVGGAFTCFLLTQRWIPQRILLLFGGGFLALTLLSLGSTGPLGELYWVFISESGIGWIFRSPLKFQMYQAFFLSILFIISIAIIRQKISHKSIVGMVMTFVLVGGSYYGITNAVSTSLNPITIPPEFYEITSYLESQPGDSKVLYLPRYNELPTVWSQGHMIAPFDMKSSRMSTYDTYLGYNFVKETLYDYPFTTGMLKSTDFFEMLSSVGIGYIVFHNDRGYSLDQRNLELLSDSQNLTLLYGKNNWYLFQLKDGPAEKFHGIYNVAEVDSISSRFSIASPSLGVIDRSISTDTIPEDSTLIKFRKWSATSEISLENKIQDTNFDTLNDDSVLWSGHVDGFDIVRNFDEATGTNYLQISTDLANKKTWSWLLGGELDVNAGDGYLVTVDVKTQNVYGTHVKIQGLKASENQWLDIAFVTADSGTSSRLSISGDSDWTSCWKMLDIPPDVTKIRYIINAGSALDAGAGTAQTLIRKPGIYNLNEVATGKNAVMEYVKISPTQYEVKISSEEPYVLAMTEAYDRGWVAVDESGREFQSISLYGMINGFYIDRTGDYTLAINYKPQQFFQIGAAVSLVAIFSMIMYFIVPLRNVITRHISDLVGLPQASLLATASYKEQVTGQGRSKELMRKSAREILQTGAALANNQRGKQLSSEIATQTKFDSNKYVVGGGFWQRSKEDLIKMDSSNLPILLAIVLLMIIPFLIPLDSSYVNLVAAYSLGSLIIGLVWKSITFYLQKFKNSEQGH